MRTDGTTTIRLRIETRDRLNRLLADTRFKGRNVDTLIDYLLDEEWKAECIRQADAWRENHPEEFEAYIRAADAGTAEWGRFLDETEGPYFRNDAERIEAGLQPLNAKDLQ